MNHFFVDPAGLDGLYNVLHRASGDADDMLRYANKHCDLRFDQQGYLTLLAGSHRIAHHRITESLERLRSLTQQAATQINLAQQEYGRSDNAAAARLDQSYPGARDPAAVRAAVTTGRPDAWPTVQRAPFADVTEPSRHLVPPNYASAIEIWSINPLTDLVSPAAWLRQVSVWLFGHDPFEGWAKALGGDWEGYVYCAAAWRIIGKAANDVGRNLLATMADVPSVWRGQAAEAEQEFQLTLGGTLLTLQPLCQRYAELYTEAAEAAKHLATVAGTLITKLIDVLLIVNLAAAAGTVTIKTGVGAVAGYSVAAYFAWQAYELYTEISKVYTNAEMSFRAISASITTLEVSAGMSRFPDLTPYRHPGQQGSEN